MNWSEFRPSVFFLLRFLGVYLALNLSYGWFVTASKPSADAITRMVTTQTARLVDWIGWETSEYVYPNKPTVAIVHDGKGIISVYEGCNGVNTAVVFVSFLVAFGPRGWTTCWFGVIGIGLIHLSNLARLVLLFIVAIRFPEHLYFVHKYFFTASLYLFVFLMWMFWVRYSKKVIA